MSLWSVATWYAGAWAGYYQLERDSLEESFRYSQLIANEFDRYRPIPELMAEHPLMEQVLTEPDNAILIARANREMKRMATIVDSSDVYLLNRNGLTIAASNYDLPTSFIGGDFSFRPYFYNAMASGQSALYFALGTTSLERGLYFSHAIRSDDNPNETIGVITMKIQVTDLEQQWRRPLSDYQAEMVIQDGDGISFVSSQPDWLYQAFEPITQARVLEVVAERRYAFQIINRIDMERLGRPPGVSDLSERVLISGFSTRPYLSVTTDLPELNWDLRILVSTQPVFWSQLRFLVSGWVLFLGAFLTWLYLRERYRREAELAQRGVFLERRVAERTADLERSNRQLKGVIRERERAQDELKATQTELIQAAKLAVLGQMSAGLNHEMNQPLTAIAAYSANSRRFLAKGDTETVDANLHEISTLCEKMAEMIRQFKVFARKPDGRPSQVDFRLPIDAALKIIQSQERSKRIDIRWHRPEQPVMVHGDLIRVEQVMVNLLANASQAVESVADPVVDIALDMTEEAVACRVSDNGPGLPANTEQVFEPFFTTKSMKQGLGLGLSISRQIADALDGKLIGQNRHDAEGAEFILTLKKRNQPS
ncbi:MAG: sensor histidine kinase [Saccharospirillum sp.]